MRDGAQVLANVLDDVSFRSTKAAQLAALQQLHAILADVCVGRLPDRPWSNQLPLFLSLQNDFETNVVSRILSSGIVSASAAQRAVDELRSKGTPSSAAADIIALTLSVLQGMALIHPRSKIYMGRKFSIQTLLELLTALRHASANPDDPDATVVTGVNTPTTDASLAVSLSPLACSVIDTLLCLLVDSPAALRVFEECNGLEAIVRTLKKVTGQQVRMKCLEFLYFYLQDEEVLAITGKPIVDLPPTATKSTPAKPRAPQTPRRPCQTPAKESRTRATPLSRTVSGDSTFSNSSELRSVSRASNASQSSVSTSHSTATNSTTGDRAEPERERRFPRTTIIMPSLSYSSSTVSSTSTLDPSQPLDSRPGTPGITPSLSDECYVPLPESPSKPNDVTPRRERRKADDTPRAKDRQRTGAPLFPKLNLFPSLAVGDKGSGGATNVGLSLLKGEVDYTPTSPRKTKPAAGVDDVFAPSPELKITAPELVSKTSTPSASKTSTPNPASKTPESSTPKTPKPVADLGVKQRHRPRASEILPRPVLVKTGPRNVSTPTPTTPTTPVDSASSPSTKNENVSPSPVTPAPATPARIKRAVIPGGTRTPGAGNGSGREELRKSVGVEGLRKSQSQAEGLRKSQVGGEKKTLVDALKSQPSSDALRKSQPSSDALRRSQPSSDVLRRSQLDSDAQALRKSQARGVEVKDKVGQGQASGLKKSTSFVGAESRRAKESGEVDRERRSGEMDRERRSVEVDREKRSMELERERRSVDVDRERRSAEVDRERQSVETEAGAENGGKLVRTSAEKKELLGAWLGNVDALVEGVQRAGVWGLR